MGRLIKVGKRENYSKKFLEILKSVNAKRPKTVIDHILKYGFITTEILKNKYGYNHPPRAVRDVREYGIPIERYSVDGSDGRKIAAYKFGKFRKESIKRFTGRTVLSKKLKDELISRFGAKCFIYNEVMEEKDLQIDHRVPYEIAGDTDVKLNPDDFMLLSASANRAKSWSCEHCENWNNEKNAAICLTCYWAYPENYTHISGKQIRRVDIIFQGKEISIYEKIKKRSKSVDKEIQELIKDILSKTIK
jgi:hypothetical protein